MKQCSDCEKQVTYGFWSGVDNDFICADCYEKHVNATVAELKARITELEAINPEFRGLIDKLTATNTALQGLVGEPPPDPPETWIPVTKRLPERHPEYGIINLSTDVYVITKGNDTRIAFYDYGAQSWYDRKTSLIIDNVSGWFPLSFGIPSTPESPEAAE